MKSYIYGVTYETFRVDTHPNITNKLPKLQGAHLRELQQRDNRMNDAPEREGELGWSERNERHGQERDEEAYCRSNQARPEPQ